ncbi:MULTISPECIES: GABA permease [Pseudomonas]|uniref:GABA permease n=3 Tax=Pseudomonas chlororaphis TaxID=587753 RepID=A0AAP9VV79_9PSED|nr:MULTISPECIES: GABA permease [Pseudomonas]AIC17518.1 gamma-aminobutyrate transporter [Pseudomonas chlororaphis]AUG38637.1 GABA permease [Pseudomonas chlororaphis]AZD83225.1 gamma-aminobutyrate (GABA) permease [Pseudomonas chlororaphis subsp. aureofaciens]AZD89810.1 gamma-aminobutyrate (GABA) permease [Pseudomonas chlororaphis subsp. aureofaciens]AZD96261.1 gamma-aminobutyrate (GABA) permease [Pseudomonas chlororaphis subsp. aureofaciens]
MSSTQTSNDLEQGLKPRHVTMLSIAGVIGAGLFVGSGHAIAEAGPAVLLAYAAAGTLVVLVMRMLAEMAVASPDTGSFSTYADRAIGHWAGFTIGWLYWWFWVLVIPLEANAAATILHAWFPDIAIWAFTLVITLLLTATNLFSVKNYGEFEFWFALIKVVAIIGFVVLGLLAIFGLLPTSNVSGVSHLFDTQGFLPNGMGAVLAAMLTTMFSFMGTEIVTIAAAESKNPGQQISKATNSVIWRIGLFYLVSIFIVVSLVPWNDPSLAQVGSYQTVLDRMGIPNAKLIVDLVVLVAVTSCLNSALYTASRMLFSLGKRGDAPAASKRTNSSGTPYWAVILSTAAAFLAVFANYVAPAAVFNFLLASSGAIALLVYLVIAVSQLRMRQKRTAAGEKIAYRMWLFPGLTYAVIVFIVGVLTIMLFQEGHRMEIIATGLLSIIVIAAGLLVARRRKLEKQAAGVLSRA